MKNHTLRVFAGMILLAASCAAAETPAQGAGNAGTIQGTVSDTTGAVIPGATVKIQKPASGFTDTETTDANGQFVFHSVPLDHYHLSVAAKGFQTLQQDVDLHSTVPLSLNLTMQVAVSGTSVTVEAEATDLVETAPISHTDISEQLTEKLPISSGSTGLSAVITQATAGVVADSNGFFHPMGEHADTSFSIDNQPINDQQSRAFSNQLPLDTVESMEVITGVAPAEFGDKTSLVVRTNTKSGLGLSKPIGSLTLGYGSFGSPSAALTFGIGGKKFGNYLAATGLRTGRFFDSPEFRPIHDRGNSQDFFDRFDWQPNGKDTLHFNVWLTRSWAQVPNTYDQQSAGQDQRQQIKTFNVAPSYTHLFTPRLLLSVNAFVRQDRVEYFPSNNSFADLPATMGENRRLTNAGLKADLSYVSGAHNIKGGVQVMHTFLSENFRLGLTDAAFNPVCLGAGGVAIITPTLISPAQCAPAGFTANPDLLPGLLPYDLTRGGRLFNFRGHADVKEESLYLQDTITLGALTLSPGLRFDNYDGLSHGSLLQPRVGLSYLIKRSGTVLRASYGRLFETPYNENLVISSSTGAGGLAATAGAFGETALRPGTRNQFGVGFEQAFGTHFVATAEYFWKFTDRAFDFDTLFSTPLVFPIEWRKSKIDGLTMRLTFPAWKGFSAYTALGHTRARFFAPEVGGILFNSPLATGPFRIDHDQALGQTTHFQYQMGKTGPWFALTWRYDSGEVAGSVPDAATALSLTADQQQQIGLFCGSTFATLSSPITACPVEQLGSTRLRIPAPGTEDDDRNPPRIQPRHMFDLGAGIDNLFRHDRPRVGLKFTVVNLTNKDALYNFLSTFSGTHFVTPRSYQAQMAFSF